MTADELKRDRETCEAFLRDRVQKTGEHVLDAMGRCDKVRMRFGVGDSARRWLAALDEIERLRDLLGSHTRAGIALENRAEKAEAELAACEEERNHWRYTAELREAARLNQYTIAETAFAALAACEKARDAAIAEAGRRGVEIVRLRDVLFGIRRDTCDALNDNYADRKTVEQAHEAAKEALLTGWEFETPTPAAPSPEPSEEEPSWCPACSKKARKP